MTVSLHKFKQLKPKHSSAFDGNVHFHVVCIAFPFSAALLFSGGAVFATAFIFTTLPYANTSSLPRVECVSLEQVPAERNAATRERTIFRARLPPRTLPEPCASPTVQRSCVEKVGCGSWAEERKGHAGGRQLAELPTRARWSSLVASQAEALNNKKDGAGVFGSPNRGGKNGL